MNEEINNTPVMQVREDAQRDLHQITVALQQVQLDLTEAHKVLEGRIADSEKRLHDRVEELENVIGNFDQAIGGISGLKQLEKQANQTGRHLHAIQQAAESFQQIAEKNCKHLNRVAENSASWIAEAIKSLKLDDFRHLTYQHSQRVEQVSVKAERRITKLAKWFHWEKIGMLVAIVISVSLLTGLFINDQSPWESHQQVLMERNAGKILLDAWPRLSDKEKQDIEQVSVDQNVV